MSKAFRMLPKSRLGKKLGFGKPRSGHAGIQIPEWTVPSQIRACRNETNKNNPPHPRPYLQKWCRESLKGGESCVLRCRLNLGRRLVGGKERIAIINYDMQVVLRTVSRSWGCGRCLSWIFCARQKFSIFSARGHWNRSEGLAGAGLLLLLLLPTHTCCALTDPPSPACTVLNPYVLTERGF